MLADYNPGDAPLCNHGGIAIDEECPRCHGTGHDYSIEVDPMSETKTTLLTFGITPSKMFRISIKNGESELFVDMPKEDVMMLHKVLPEAIATMEEKTNA